MAVYGNVERQPASETTTPCAPRSYYGVSKLAAEHALRIATHEGLHATSLRFFTVYGPGQNLANLKQGIASIYLAYLLERRDVPVTGSLDRFRDLVFVDDVVELCFRILTRPTAPSGVYNVGTGRATTVRELIAMLVRLLGLPPNHPIRELPGSASDQFGLYADTTRAHADFGWQATTPLETGLRVMVDWARQELPIRQ
jgi:UDP-glucose 4-epimerase